MIEQTQTLYCARCLTTFGSNGDGCPNLGCGKARPAEGWGRMYQPDDVFDRNYKVEKTLALGGAGVTYLCREIGEADELTGPKIALKLLFATRDHGSYLQRLATEAQILRQLAHPNIVQYLGFVHRSGHSPYLLTQFERGGSLLDHMRRVGTLSVKMAAKIGRQVCWALEKAHDKGIIHRDLKPENMLLSEVVDKETEPVVRVADFGIAKVQGGLDGGLTRIGSFVGTPQYAAPEQFIGQPAITATDVYSLGAVLVFLMTARPMVKNAHRLEPDEAYLALEEKLPPTIHRPNEPEVDAERMNAVLASAMDFDPKRRCTVNDLDRMLAAIIENRQPDVPQVVAARTTLSNGGVAPLPVQLLSIPPIDEPMSGGMGTATRSDDAVQVLDSDPILNAPVETVAPRVRRRDQDGLLGWLLGGVGMVVLFFVFVALAGAAWWMWGQQSDLDAVDSGQVVELVAVVPDLPPRDLRGDPSPDARRLVNVLNRRTLRKVRRLWPRCSVSPSGAVHLDIVVEAGGQVRLARPVDASAPVSHWCLTEKLQGRRIRWSGEMPMRFRFNGELGG